MQAGEEAHLQVSYYDDDGDGVADCPAVSQPKCYFLGLKDGHFWQKQLFSDHKKWHFWCQNQNSETTFIVQTFPKYGLWGFHFMNLSLLGPILAKFQFG